MRRMAGLAVVVLTGVVAFPLAPAMPVAADSPTLMGGPVVGPVGTTVSYTYHWDQSDCLAAGVSDGDPIFLSWTTTGEEMGQGIVSNSGGTTDCTAALTGRIPNDAIPGPQSVTVQIDLGSGIASAPFTVRPPSNPTPTPRPTATTRPTSTTGPTVAPTTSPRPAPTPRPLQTPPPFIGGGGTGGSGGGPPEGGAACSGGIGSSPTSADLSSDIAHLVGGADPTAIQIGVLASSAYYQDAGGNPLGFVNRLFDDVLRHDPTPVEVSTALTILNNTGGAGRTQLAADVVLSPEARAIRVDQAFHALLSSYPSSAELATYVNRLARAGVPGISSNVMIEQLAASQEYYALSGRTGGAFLTKLYGTLLNRSPTAAERDDDATLLAEIRAGSAVARLDVADKIVSSTEFLTLQVISIYANYMHPTCRALMARECTTGVGTPTSSDLATALKELAGTVTEEQIIAGVLGSPQYYANHGSTQAGLVKAVYEDLLGRAPTGAELSAALQKYPNDPLGHTEFALSMTASPAYRDLIVSLFYQQLLLRAPLPGETLLGERVLDGDVPSLQTPDQTLVEQIVATPEYLADTGGTANTFVVQTIDILLLQPPPTAQPARYLDEPLPHGATWQSGVAASIIDSSAYQSDFVRGVYAKFLTDTDCATTTAVAASAGDPGFLKQVPGGWFGLGVVVGVLLMGGSAALFFTLERRRFARIYPDDLPRYHV